MLFLTANLPAAATLDLGLWQICLRLLCAMVVGLIIGTEREYTNRPAGMRTHILVALGACVVTITGQMIFSQYHALGASPDPARLSAQIITGVGFLGAGTIMREGASVKGLTTAASVWAVACLGIAAGFGYYAVAIAGMVFIMVTLTIFEVIQHRLMDVHAPHLEYILETADISAALDAVNAMARSTGAQVRDLHAQRVATGYRVFFQADHEGARSKARQKKFFEGLAKTDVIQSIRTTQDITAAKP